MTEEKPEADRQTAVFPKRDLRAIDQWLRSIDKDGPFDQFPVESLREHVRGILIDQLRKERTSALGSVPFGSTITDRPLDYPFTKGITVVNDGVAYGELVRESRGPAQTTVLIRRTRTGRIEFRPERPPGSDVRTSDDGDRSGRRTR